MYFSLRNINLNYDISRNILNILKYFKPKFYNIKIIMYYNDAFHILNKNIRIVSTRKRENLERTMLNISISSSHELIKINIDANASHFLSIALFCLKQSNIELLNLFYFS